ncbi:DUF4290 domain-containing protein [Sunxiuqinia dokdonensis]|jgi:hypothetical protein|uniref:Methionyl-tRNA formyltransferase n=1 Tax=Sunxiuqinia dokdonensis TaxID=1409788 RepID=A0A0L8VB74_9BACT|nr:DUF4290 domain-containing protein [Sunxiuqinia dokdonensis]KOH45613.1 hypothetical protein NC99_15600 [Sunxiuqinia dokdonensis]
MDYNSNRKKLPLPEYGRNIQNMVDHIMTIEDREERNLAAQTIIDIMGNLYPYLRDINDFKHKLWDHLAIMAGFNLDIDYPYDPPKPETFQEPPKKVPYSSNHIKLRYYGKTIEEMVEKAAEYESGEEKEVLIKLLANHMKKSYLTWNKDAVDDEKIYKDLELLSKGRIKREGLELAETRDILFRSAPRKKQNTGPGRGPKKHRKND